MNKQPEALRLADELERWLIVEAKTRMSAAAELRRLHEVNQELLVALQVVLRDYTAVHDIGDVEMQPAIYQAHAAITKAGGSNEP